jgi:hypothetical protein
MLTTADKAVLKSYKARVNGSEAYLTNTLKRAILAEEILHSIVLFYAVEMAPAVRDGGIRECVLQQNRLREFLEL